MIAPYATGLAAMVDPQGGAQNFAQLAARARWAATAFTRRSISPARLPDNENVAIVRNFMAHHQGMTIVSIANTFLDAQMRARFHREPMIQASELLLQERMPRNVAVAHPRAEEVNTSAVERARIVPPTVRRIRAGRLAARRSRTYCRMGATR